MINPESRQALHRRGHRLQARHPNRRLSGTLCGRVWLHRRHGVFQTVPYLGPQDARLLQLGITEVQHYTPDDDATLASEIIESPDFNKLNRLKKVNTEAFFYARRLEELG